MESKHAYPVPPPSYSEFGGNPILRPAPETHFMTTAPVASASVPNVLGSAPCMATCPTCHSRQLTAVTFEPNSKTHLVALLLCLLGCICCCCIPYCAESCQTAVHKCGRCGAYIGSYQN
ncbi:lipopolysaccharide-induced tumor necrosis factor-alpha factor homolog isoform X2 [Drosophila novamexicana]|uniref:lipopolysaccharide-induced tumor necrosis factor-alpha factor homolog isoform X2 n=1 Tax=Drosophila novamexicana TaxID=47314 RepID=UPI0011E5D0FD|nr:lipopolysaccharide-induced tumor necrosis factor-alpha factor homolog isoform X2 [Drosophila novamexicana]